MKDKTCKVCKQRFTPMQSFQTWCCVEHGVILANKKLEKIKKSAKAKECRADKVKRDKLKTRSDWLREVQTIVNAYVRARDSALGCCSCDKPATWGGQWHASHLRSVGAASSVRFNLWNIAKSCSVCNNHLSGNIGSYLLRARERLGDDRVDWLYSQNHVVSYDIEYLQKFKRVMSKRLRRLRERIEMCC